MQKFKTEITNVLIIGSGGAGLRAAIEAKSLGLDVKILGKRDRNDVHTGLAAGGINASFANLDKEDSWEQHFFDTFHEGYCLANPHCVELMAKNAPSLVNEIDQWGAGFNKLANGKLDQRFFGAHKYRRTCYSGDYTGLSILRALLSKADELNIPLYDNQYVTDLLVEEGICFGAIAINKNNGKISAYYADAVILCTGGHTRIWKKSSSRRYENNGDGYYLALKAGCSLIDMEMVQFHPTGMVTPDEFAGTLVTEAVRGEGGILKNGRGERFMTNYDPIRMELSSRDRIAIANYTEINEGRFTPNGGVFLDISHKGKDFIIKKIPKIYRQFLDTQMLDISKKPMEVAPTAHYSMGGIEVNPYNHATCIKGLFAAGEVAGGLHGANRLGGNSLAEILVFGKFAGKAAALYSIELKSQKRSLKNVNKIVRSISKSIKKGEELVITIQHELRNIMWEYCGVIKSKESIEEGIRKLETLFKRLELADIRVEGNNFKDLIDLYDCRASLYSAKATLLSALNRNESRGSHQRSDFKELDENFKFNLKIIFKNGNLELNKQKLIKISNELEKILKTYSSDNDIKGKLLE